jgi:hypothetical protein
MDVVAAVLAGFLKKRPCRRPSTQAWRSSAHRRQKELRVGSSWGGSSNTLPRMRRMSIADGGRRSCCFAPVDCLKKPQSQRADGGTAQGVACFSEVLPGQGRRIMAQSPVNEWHRGADIADGCDGAATRWVQTHLRGSGNSARVRRRWWLLRPRATAAENRSWLAKTKAISSPAISYFQSAAL